MRGYKAIEEAVATEFMAHFGDYLDSKTVVGGNSDVLFNEMFEENKDYGVLLDYGGGTRPEDETFRSHIWQWSIIGVFLIRFKGDSESIEGDLRSIVDLMGTLFLNNHTLGGVTPRAYLDRIDVPEVLEVNNTPFYWLPFEIFVWEKI